MKRCPLLNKDKADVTWSDVEQMIVSQHVLRFKETDKPTLDVADVRRLAQAEIARMIAEYPKP